MPQREFKDVTSVPTSRVCRHPQKPGIYLPVHLRPRRLPEVNYASAQCWCFVTFRIHAQCTTRLVGPVGQVVWRVLLQELERAQLAAIVMMPDHVHILLAPSGDGESISDIVRRMKSLSHYHLRHSRQVALKWQSSFYDHVLRAEQKQGDVLKRWRDIFLKILSEPIWGIITPFDIDEPIEN